MRPLGAITWIIPQIDFCFRNRHEVSTDRSGVTADGDS